MARAIERSLVRNGLKEKIQNGDVTKERVISCPDSSTFYNETRTNITKMLSQEKWDKLYEEDELVKKIFAEVKLRATEAKCLQRIQMLRSLAEHEDDATRP